MTTADTPQENLKMQDQIDFKSQYADMILDKISNTCNKFFDGEHSSEVQNIFGIKSWIEGVESTNHAVQTIQFNFTQSK